MNIYWINNVEAFINTQYDATTDMFKLFSSIGSLGDIINAISSNVDEIKPIMIINYNGLNDIYVASLKRILYKFFVNYTGDISDIKLISNLNRHYPEKNSIITLTNKYKLQELMSKDRYDKYYSNIKYLITFSNKVDLKLYNILSFVKIIHVTKNLSGDNIYIKNDDSDIIKLGFEDVSNKSDENCNICGESC